MHVFELVHVHVFELVHVHFSAERANVCVSGTNKKNDTPGEVAHLGNTEVVRGAINTMRYAGDCLLLEETQRRF